MTALLNPLLRLREKLAPPPEGVPDEPIAVIAHDPETVLPPRVSPSPDYMPEPTPLPPLQHAIPVDPDPDKGLAHDSLLRPRPVADVIPIRRARIPGHQCCLCVEGNPATVTVKFTDGIQLRVCDECRDRYYGLSVAGGAR